MSALELLRSYGNGKIDYPTLVKEFSALPMAVQKPATSVAEAFTRGEETNDADIPGALDTAAYAGIINDRQEQELRAIYRSKVAAG